MDDVEDLKKALQAKRRKTKTPATEMLSTGSTLLNLACSGKANGGFMKGKYYFVVGDSASGKTFLCLTCFAEAAHSKQFADYDLIYDNVEDGALMDFAAYFGQKTADRIIPPAGTKEEPEHSSTVEEFYFNLDSAHKRKRPFIYVLDSMDALTSTDDESKFEDQKKHYEKVKRAKAKGKEVKGEVSGTYGTSKAKLNSVNLRLAINRLSDTGSILVIIAQTRDNIGAGPFTFDKKTRSGGHALKFYATLEIWLSVKEKLKERIKGKDREIGIRTQCQVKKNRLTGRNRRVFVPLYHSVGIDDVGGCIDYLVDEGHWKKTDKIRAPELNLAGSREELVKAIEAGDLERDLRRLVSSVWDEIEARCQVDRKTRYE